MDFNEIFKQFQETLAEADKKTFSAKSGGGLVEVTINGKLEVIDLKIDDSLLEDKESLQILLISAINDAIKMALDDKKQEALNMFSGFKIDK